MTTYQTASQWTLIRDPQVLSPKALGYFRARLKNRLHELVLIEFMKLEKEKGFTKADMARRIHKRPELVTRLLGAPGNWTLDTVSDLLLAMGYELTAQVKKFDEVEDRATTVVTKQEIPSLRLVEVPSLREVSSTAEPMYEPIAAAGGG